MLANVVQSLLNTNSLGGLLLALFFAATLSSERYLHILPSVVPSLSRLSRFLLRQIDRSVFGCPRHPQRPPQGYVALSRINHTLTVQWSIRAASSKNTPSKTLPSPIQA